MAFEKSGFIKPNKPFVKEFTFENSAPIFRKKITLQKFEKATIKVCGLGYGYYYINGKPVTEDVFTAPVSDYNKTLWYCEYDVTDLLNEGINTVAVICGNGFFNEEIPTRWDFHNAKWRDNPKFIMELELDGKIVMVSDSSWKCNPDSPVYFNQLRLGEYYNANIANNWYEPDFDDSGWDHAIPDNNPPKGTFRKCECEPIREVEVFKPCNIIKIDSTTCIYDFGQNMSGYCRIKVKGNKNDVIVLRHSECINENNRLEYYGMNKYYRDYHNCPMDDGFQTDKFICSGEEIVWSPKFTYHGFRYVEVSGVDYCDKLDISAIFVHQDIKTRTTFECSDKYLNDLFRCGVYSTYSNMFYNLTDCPTREKFGWTNDAQSSCEQVLTNFESEKLLTKWHQDIKDAMKENGDLPGIVPSSGWGYEWGNGPVSDGILFEIPYKVYVHTGNSELLENSLEFFERYLANLETKRNENGFIEVGLYDWAAPGGKNVVGVEFINDVLIYYFNKITALSAKIKGDFEKEALYLKNAEDLKNKVKNIYINENGECTINEQCSVSMLIYYDIFDDLQPLKNQLAKLLEDNGFHLDCGMVGLRRLPHALDKCGLSEYFYKLLKADGYPSYTVWMNEGATTLWEKWDIHFNADSKNHHMYSDFMSWLVKKVGGISINEEKPGELEFVFNPYVFDEINDVTLNYHTVCGDITVKLTKTNNEALYSIKKDKQIKLVYKGNPVNDEYEVKYSLI